MALVAVAVEHVRHRRIGPSAQARVDTTVRRALMTLDESPRSGASLWHEVRPLYEDAHVEQLYRAVLIAAALRGRCVAQLLDAAEDLRTDPDSPFLAKHQALCNAKNNYVLSHNDLWTLLRVFRSSRTNASEGSLTNRSADQAIRAASFNHPG